MATTKYPTGNDQPTERHNAVGQLSGDISTEDTEEVVFDSTTLDEKVRQLVESAGFKYNVKQAVADGTMRKVAVTDEFAEAMLRLEKAAPILNAVVAHMNRQAANGSPLARLLMGKAKGSPSGSASGSESGSASANDTGSRSGSHNTRRDDPGSGTQSAARRAGVSSDTYAGSESGAEKLLIVGHLLRRAVQRGKGSASGSQSGSTSGSESGSSSGSQSGEMSKALMERFLAGDREAGLALMNME